MPQLTREQFEALLAESDPFKLAIRGHSALEAELDESIDAAMEGRRPDELKAPSSRVRLALAVGTGVLPAVQQGPVKALPKWRHEFAHGEIDELTPKRAQELFSRPSMGY